jgi:hypothetical protein
MVTAKSAASEHGGMNRGGSDYSMTRHGSSLQSKTHGCCVHHFSYEKEKKWEMKLLG